MAERFDVTLEGLRRLRRRVDHQQLESGDWSLIAALVCKQITRAEGKQERMVAKIAAAQLALAATADGPGGPVIDADFLSSADSSTRSSQDASALGGRAEPDSSSAGDGAAKPDAKKGKGHGRNGAGAYAKAKHVFHELAAGLMGMLCVACGICRMNRYRDKIIIRIVGQPLFAAELHHCEQARCRNCGRIVRALCPADVHTGIGGDYVKYAWSACATLIVMHYFGGAPFKRLESLHAGWGIPMADANQWQMVNASDDLLLRLYKALERHGIQSATNFRIDDTGSEIVAVRRQIAGEVAILKLAGESTKDVRTGINATGVYFETPDGPITLFFTGRHHAGEIVDQLLEHRQTLTAKLVKITDGASKNFDHAHADKLTEATCNAHALLKFRAIKDKYPREYEVAGRVYKMVFDRDDEAKNLGLAAEARMLHHRRYSLPLMKELRAMCEEKLTSKLVEPNSPLWEPLSFIINQWERLVRFCEVPGVPLDTNLVEQALIMPVRYLAGSFNYQTEDGAVVGDHFMSLIATARAHGVEPVAYLTECLRNHEDLARRPEYYLPWVYRERLKEGDSPPDPARAAAA